MRKCLVFSLAVALVINMQMAFFLLSSDNAVSDEAIYEGHITSNEEWTSAKSPYFIEGNVTVDEGVNLTIEPGVEVRFNGNYGLYIEGNLTAMGNSRDRIKFTSNFSSPSPRAWDRIQISSTGRAIIRYCEVTYSNWGIFLDSSSYNYIEHNNISKGYEGIHLLNSKRNTILSNNITNNNRGLYLSSSDENILRYNHVTSNTLDGLTFHNAKDNELTNNNISFNNQYGLNLSVSQKNYIFHNNFIDNTHQAYDDFGYNIWNDSYPSGGNYWSDYDGEDVNKSENQDVPGSDGIGDTNYTGIDGDPKAIDRFPLMNKAPDIQPRLIYLISPLNGSVIKQGTIIDFEILNPDIDYVNYSTSFEGVNHTFEWPYDYDIHTNDTWPNGTISVCVYVVDNSGSVNSSEFVFIFDSIKPEIVLNSPFNESMFGAGKIIDISINEPYIKSVTHTLTYKLNDELSTLSQGVLPFPYDLNTSSWDKDGNYTLEIRAVDIAGNSNSTFYVFTVDSTPPEIRFISPGKDSVIRPGMPLEFNVTDDHLHIVNYSINDEENQSFTIEYIIDTSLFEDGHYSITVNAVDTISNSNSELFEFVIDSIPPIVTLVSPHNNSVIKAGVPLNFSVIEENMGTFVYSRYVGFSDSLEEPYEINTSSWYDGTYHLNVNVTDRADHSHLSWYNISIDSSAPQITPIALMNNSFIKAGRDILFNIYDAHLLYANYSIDGGDRQAFDPSNKIETTGWLDGPYDIEVFAGDVAGNNISVVFTFNLDSTRPNVVSTDPRDDQENLPISTSIWITFNEIMNKTSVFHALSISPNIIFATSWSSDDLSIIITPQSNLANGTKYTVRINTTAKDLAGNALLNDLVFSFKTVSDEDEDDSGLWWRILFIVSVFVLISLIYLFIFRKKGEDKEDEETSKDEEEEQILKKEQEKDEVREKSPKKKFKVKEKTRPSVSEEKVGEKFKRKSKPRSKRKNMPKVKDRK